MGGKMKGMLAAVLALLLAGCGSGGGKKRKLQQPVGPKAAETVAAAAPNIAKLALHKYAEEQMMRSQGEARELADRIAGHPLHLTPAPSVSMPGGTPPPPPAAPDATPAMPPPGVIPGAPPGVTSAGPPGSPPPPGAPGGPPVSAPRPPPPVSEEVMAALQKEYAELRAKLAQKQAEENQWRALAKLLEAGNGQGVYTVKESKLLGEAGPSATSQLVLIPAGNWQGLLGTEITFEVYWKRTVYYRDNFSKKDPRADWEYRDSEYVARPKASGPAAG